MTNYKKNYYSCQLHQRHFAMPIWNNNYKYMEVIPYRINPFAMLPNKE